MKQAVFKDSYGKVVSIGSKIIIEKDLNYQHFQNRVCTIVWDGVSGMYRFKFDDEPKSKITHDFYGVYKFKKVSK